MKTSRSSAAPEPTFRSAAVARMAQMPVATLRIWEQRYQAVRPATSDSGHRLYSAADVQRVLLLRRLTGAGHAIGAIAGLDTAALQQLADSALPATARAALRWVVVGPVLAARLQRAAFVGAMTVFESLAEAARARPRRAADLLLWHAPELLPGPAREWRAALKSHQARQAAVVYRYAAPAALQALSDAGVAQLREPADDAALATWLAALEAGAARPAGGPEPAAVVEAAGAPAPRRFDDAALAAFAARPPVLACECPRHVAELLMQLCSFEAYSAGCSQRDAADAELHRHLQQVAGSARMLFEAALERLARHEGLPLPRTAAT